MNESNDFYEDEEAYYDSLDEPSDEMAEYKAHFDNEGAVELPVHEVECPF